MASNYPNTLKFLTTYGNQVEQEIETRLAGYGKYASGKLHDSIGYKIKETKENISIGFEMEDYGTYVDKGTKPSKYANAKGKGTGKSKFIESLMKWCVIKGYPKSAAFPIRLKIWKEGLPATNFFTIPIKRSAKRLSDGVEKNLAKDVELLIQKEINVSFPRSRS